MDKTTRYVFSIFIKGSSVQAAVTIKSTISSLDEIQVARYGPSSVIIHHNRKPIDANSRSDIYTFTCGPEGMVKSKKRSFPVSNEGERSICLLEMLRNPCDPSQILESCALCQEFMNIDRLCQNVQKDFRFFVPSWPDTFKFKLADGQKLSIRFVHAPNYESSSWSSDDLFQLQRSIPAVPFGHYPFLKGIENIYKPDIEILRYGIRHEPGWIYNFFGLDREEEREKEVVEVESRIKFLNPYT
jgi:hypothetical protein